MGVNEGSLQVIAIRRSQLKHLYDTGCDLLSYIIVIVVVAVDRVLVIISLDVLAVGGGVGREGVVKQMLATQCA